jgi:hypothetical protein
MKCAPINTEGDAKVLDELVDKSLKNRLNYMKGNEIITWFHCKETWERDR